MSGAPRGEMEAALSELTPFVHGTVRRICLKYQSTYDQSAKIDDNVQDVLIKLMATPPSQKPKKSACVTMLSWLKATTTRIMIDKWRKETVGGADENRIQRKQPLSGLENQATDSVSGEHPDVRRFEARDELRDVLVFLNNTYPKGAELVSSWQKNPDSTPAEIAEIICVSMANYYQILRRTKVVLSDYVRGKRQERETE